jgi:hypothetical protein
LEYSWSSISDSLPLLTISAEKAAEQILTACARGDPEVILTLPTQLAVRLEGIMPELVSSLLQTTNRLLPGPGPDGEQAKLGKDIQSALAPSFLTALSDAAARENNEIAPAEQGCEAAH